MTGAWLQIRVELLGGRGTACEPAPGRIFMVGPKHSFGDFAEAIDGAFGRWDLAHLHSFELTDGRRIGIPDPDAPEAWLDESALNVTEELGSGDTFEYVFDLGDVWRHRCTVEPEKVDPAEEYGEPPSAPAPIWGWGAIPDQYGRSARDE